VQLLLADGRVGYVADQPAIMWFQTRGRAREAYRYRLKALRKAGWERVEQQGCGSPYFVGAWPGRNAPDAGADLGR
jgi:hypothetical protein